jgi:hypothetical protein
VAEIDDRVHDRRVGGMLEHVADETTIDLQLGERQRRQVTERCLALAEVVEADLDPGGRQAAQLDRSACRISKDRRLGHLDHQPAGVHGHLAQDLDHAWSMPRDWASERKSAARMKPRAAIGIRLTTA